MAFTLHPVAFEDAEDITRIFQEAFKHDHIMSYFHPNVPRDIVWNRDLDFYRGLIKEGDIYGGRITKAVDTSTGYMLQFSSYSYQHHDFPMLQWLSNLLYPTAKPWHSQDGNTRIRLHRNNRLRRMKRMKSVNGIMNFLKARIKNCKRISSSNWLRGGRGLLCLRKLIVSFIYSKHIICKYLLFLRSYILIIILSNKFSLAHNITSPPHPSRRPRLPPPRYRLHAHPPRPRSS